MKIAPVNGAASLYIAGVSGEGTERRMSMMPNYYDNGRMAQAHRQELLREAEHERRLSQLSQPKRSVLRLPTSFKMYWRAFRIRLQGRFQQRNA
jgi:hypothetical protein